MLDILVVNLNCLEHTKNIISDLSSQHYKNFQLTLVDQNSREKGTSEFLNSLSNIKIIRNTYNVPLNHVWNEFVKNSEKPFVLILNNDIRIPKNFLDDVVDIFLDNPKIGAVIHPTNHPDHDQAYPELKYEILEHGKYRQGWDICMRREAWTPIPEILKIYCGDDFIYENMYSLGYDCAIALSSPIIHYLGQTRKSEFNKHMPERNPKLDIANYRAMGYTHHMVPPEQYTIVDYNMSDVTYIRESS